MTGKSVEEAKDRALDELGVDERDAEFEILEEPRSGLFGLTRGEAQVRARVRPTSPRPKQERGRRRSGGGGGRGRSGQRRERSSSGEGGSGADSPEETGRSGGGGGGRGRGGGRDRGREDARRASSDAAAPAAEREGSRNGARSRPPGGGERTRGGGRARGADRSEDDKGEAMSEASVKEQAAAAEEFLSGLVDAFGLSATVEAEEADDAVEVQINGDDLGLLIGPKGRTLWALQELTKTVVQRQQGGGLSTRIRVDVAGYRERRRVALERFTKDAAAAVLESGVARALEPMGAADRKVVHDTVNEMEGVVTRSEGEDPRRRVVIAPE